MYSSSPTSHDDPCPKLTVKTSQRALRALDQAAEGHAPASNTMNPDLRSLSPIHLCGSTRLLAGNYAARRTEPDLSQYR